MLGMKSRLLGSVLLLGFLVHCAGKEKKEVPVVNGAWSTGMASMGETLNKLMPYVFVDKAFNDSRNRREVRELIADFAAKVQAVPKHAGETFLGKDPIIGYSLNQLKTNAQMALVAFENGHPDFAQYSLRRATGLCFTCHSTQDLGPKWDIDESPVSRNFQIAPTERADYFVATRQFDRAIQVLEGVVKSPNGQNQDGFEQLSSIRKYLLLQVRINDRPGPAIAALDQLLQRQDLPVFVKQDAKTWRDGLKAWQRESKDHPEPLTYAKILLHRADGLRLSSGYQAGFIDYLRASTLLHEGLRGEKNASRKAQIYQLLGESYETLADMGIWDLPEIYYEACIRALPGSTEARTCFRNFERSIILAYSGSAGIFIPREEQDRLSELKKMAGYK